MPRLVVYTLPRKADLALAPVDLLQQVADLGCLQTVDPDTIHKPNLVELFREKRNANDLGVLWIDIDREGESGLKAVADAETFYKNWFVQAKNAFSASFSSSFPFIYFSVCFCLSYI